MGLVEVERLQERHAVDVRMAPFFLDPTTPPGGKPARYVTPADAPPTPIEQRAETLGIRFNRGRTWTSNSHLALEAAEATATHTNRDAFHRRIFKAYFEDLEDIADIEVLVKCADETGVDGAALRAALERGDFRAQVDDGINWSRGVGVSAVPTFIFDERYGVVGAQPLEVLEAALAEVQAMPPEAED